jgi:outer membrane murein-binding lipoprotein Lpp
VFALPFCFHPSHLSRTEKVQKRASNVLKLSQEHEKLKDELRAMTARLEAAERKQKEMARADLKLKNGATN